jgi:hypothetical protein
MTDDGELQDFIAGQSGVHLHRKRSLTAFSHVQPGPLLDVLLSITRPVRRVANTANIQRASSSADSPAPKASIIRKGMVNYRRELRGGFEE